MSFNTINYQENNTVFCHIGGTPIRWGSEDNQPNIEGRDKRRRRP
jgi:hypothetical protein